MRLEALESKASEARAENAKLTAVANAIRNDEAPAAALRVCERYSALIDLAETVARDDRAHGIAVMEFVNADTHGLRLSGYLAKSREARQVLTLDREELERLYWRALTSAAAFAKVDAI